MDRTEAAALLKQWALEAGFDRAGVAALGPAEHGPAFRRWLERGDQASMAYLERRVEERLDPRRLLPGARSALCVALQYAPLAGEPEPGGDLWPRVARYARGRDYHDLMGERLRRLGERVAGAFPGCATRGYVDTGPVLERDLAASAGLGAIGKNTMLLHPEGGSWFLIGELLLTLDLAPDLPLADLCGTCTRLPRSLPDRSPRRALPAAQRPLHQLLDDRAPRRDSGRDALRGSATGCSAATSARRSARGTRHPRGGRPSGAAAAGGARRADPGRPPDALPRRVRRALSRQPDEARPAGGAAAQRRDRRPRTAPADGR